MDRVVPPIFTAVNGDKATGVTPSDDPRPGLLATVNAMESMAGAMYQNFVETLTTPQLRGAVMGSARSSARHAAVRRSTPQAPPRRYVNPVVIGGDPPEVKNGLTPLFAIPSEFGTLSPTQLVIGAASSAGTRTTLPIDTPAEQLVRLHRRDLPGHLGRSAVGPYTRARR